MIDVENAAEQRAHFWSRLNGAQELTRRTQERFSVEATRPLALRQIDAEDRPIGPWYTADILDISLGGLCLLVMHDTAALPLGEDARVQLDLRAQPGFGRASVTGSIRWFVESGFVLSLGVSFDQPFTEFPELLPCRRAARRELDPDFDIA